MAAGQATPPAGPSAAVVCTASFALHQTARPLESFLKYHLAKGFKRVFLFVDNAEDTKTLAVARSFPEDIVEVFVAGEELDAMHASHCSAYRALAPMRAEVSARQLLNAELAMQLAADRGISWLVHLDADELLFTRAPSLEAHFSELEREGVDQMTYLNHEAVPEVEDAEDYFAATTLFRRHHFVVPLTESARRALHFWMDRTQDRQYLLFYDNGKSACRVLHGAVPQSQHLWKLPGGRRSCTALADARRLQLEGYRACQDPCVLHFPVCGLSWFQDKYRTLGAFPDTWLGGKVPQCFHTRAREVWVNEGAHGLRQLYIQEVLLDDAAEARRQLEAEVCVRILDHAVVLGGDQDATASAPPVAPPAPAALEPKPVAPAPMDAGPQGIERGWILSKAIAGYL